MSDPITPLGSPGQVAQAGSLTSTFSAARIQGGEDVSANRLAPGKTPSAPGAEAVPGTKDQLELSPAGTAATAKEPAAKKPDVMEAAKEFQEYLNNLPTDLKFQPDMDSGVVVFKVVNPITQKVLREYPPEEVVEMAKALRQQAQDRKKDHSGILLDQHL